MHPKEFKAMVEHVSDLYTSMFEELHTLRMENKQLIEDLNKQQMMDSKQMIENRQMMDEITKRKCTSSPLQNLLTYKKVIKMGSDWFIEGDYIIQLSLMKRLRLPSPICNAKISRNGLIAFTCNKSVFLFRKNTFFLMEDSMKPNDPMLMINDLTENYRGVFDFMGEDLVYLYKNTVYRNSGDMTLEAVATHHKIYSLVISNDLIYIGTQDRTIYVYQEGACVGTHSHKELFKSFEILGDDIIGCGEYKIENVTTGEVIEETGRIYTFSKGENSVYYGGENGVIKILKDGALSTIVQGKPILSVREWGRYLLIATQDKKVYIRSFESDKLMWIVGGDNVIDISVNSDEICCVDNNGSLRLWRVVDK